VAQVAAGPADVDALLERAWTLRRENDRAAALVAVEQAAAIAPDRVDVRELQELLAYEVRGWEAGLGLDHVAWRRGRPAWWETHGYLRKNTAWGAGIARGSHAERAGSQDDELELELYPGLRAGYVALGVSVSADAALYARSSVSAELFRSVTSRLEASVGWRRFDVGPALNIFTGSVGLYQGDYLFGARVHQIVHDGTSVTLSARRYLTSQGEYVGARMSVGSTPAEVRSTTDFDVQSSRSLGAEAQLLFGARWVLRVQVTGGREELPPTPATAYWSGSLEIAARF
jgi:YaiO family outer membrane protein